MPCALSTAFSPAMGEQHEAPAPIDRKRNRQRLAAHARRLKR
jgi:hypothetical protein